jgi:Na+-translocating ferredoxin:NAD+ oxidoreductase subunit B
MVTEMDIYKHLAQTLDALPNGFPSTNDGSELRLLKKLFTPEEAELAVLLTPELETADAIAARTGRGVGELRKQLKDMVRRGLISTGRTEGGLGFGLMPFVVGIFEMQVNTIDKELALLVEAYFRQNFGEALRVEPQFHRVIPIGESVRNSMEVHPYESATGLVNAAQSWGVIDCICRKQKTLIGEACVHPIDVCMVLDERPGVFDNSTTVRTLNREEALATLKRAADAGLVHSVSNNQKGVHYICNCCTCSCGILRGMASLGVANVVARSAFVNTVDETLCNACENCLSYCQFDALKMDITVQVNPVRCVGCGVCVPACPSEALILVRRPEDEILSIPTTQSDWMIQRAAARGLND